MEKDLFHITFHHSPAHIWRAYLSLLINFPVLDRLSAAFIISLSLLFCHSAPAQTASPVSPADGFEKRTTAKQETPKDLPVLSAVERELKGGETHSFRIQLTAGQLLYALVEQKDIDVVTAAFGPDGKQLTETDSPNDRWGTEPILLVASITGEHRMDVKSPNGKDPAGRYVIKIIALREATPIDKGHVAAEMAFDEGAKLRAQQTATARRAAIEKYQQAVLLFHSAGDTYRQALTLLSIGITYVQMNDFRKALEYFNETLTLAAAIGDPRMEAGTETYIGGMLDILGDVTRSLNHYHRALKLARENGWRLAEGNALNNIGKIYNDLADWQKALEYYGKALPVYRALGNQIRQTEAITLNNIGIAYSMSGEQQKALDYLQQSLPLLRTGGDKNVEAYTLSNIGSAYSRNGEYQNALTYYSQAQAIQRETGNRGREAETLGQIGVVYAALGQHEKALEYHLHAVQIQRETGNLRREALALTNLGEAYNLLGQHEKALEQFEKSLSILRSIGDLSSAARALEGTARAEASRGNLDDARKHIEESLALIETVRARSGSLQLRASYRASMEKAYEFYIDVLMQEHAKSPARGYDGEALQASERGRARSLLEQLSEARLDIRQGVDAALIEQEHNLTQLLNAKAQREIQLKARKGSNEEIGTLQREISALEDEYQQVLAAIRKASPAYAALTQPHPLGLKEIQQQLDPNTVLLEYSLGDERSYLWAVTQGSLKTYELPKREQIQKLAQQVYESLTARSVVKSLETPAQRETRIAQADTQFQQAAAELSQMILAPAAAEMGTKRLVVVADGALQYVPFSALSVVSGQLSVAKERPGIQGPRKTDNGQLTGYRPLILDHEVVSLPSASALAVQRQTLANRKPAPKTVAVIADPVFSTDDGRFKAGARAIESREDNRTQTTPAESTRIIEHLAGSANGQLAIRRLPFTRQEAEQILAVAPAGSNLKALDFRANRTIATSGELSKYRYVHFATHGYLDSTRADLSAVVLSLVDEEGKPQDGFLRALDIYNLKLPAELVVLSACETGLGKDVKGEGLVGLTRGFMYAGARRVVVSLWNVNDKATAALMQRLYTGMLRNNKTPAASLRAAQIEMLRVKQWQSPYYWAAFVMQGEWK
jgi:CHAT domain-containing protein/tetratricopeptide (TPR) repeat protein